MSYLENIPTEVIATIISSYLNNIKLLITLLVKYTPRNLVTEQPDYISLPIKTVGYENFLVVITHPFKNHRACQKLPTIQPTIAHSNQ